MFKSKRSLYWFFRSFIFTFVIVACVFSLLVGCAECYVTMHKNISGESIEVIELKDNKVLLLGKEIISLDFINDFKENN